MVRTTQGDSNAIDLEQHPLMPHEHQPRASGLHEEPADLVSVLFRSIQLKPCFGGLDQPSSAMLTLKAASRLVTPSRTLSSALSKSIFMPSSRAALRSWSRGVRFWMS